MSGIGEAADVGVFRLRPPAYRDYQSLLIPPWKGGRLQPEKEGDYSHKERIFIIKHRRGGLCY
jgi:hypothetical protein